MTSGIYMIFNVLTNKFYIGSAINFKNRFNKHIWDLKKNIHHSPHLQNVYNKYGLKVLEFHTIEYCSIDNLYIREQWWFDISHCWNPNIGYNICSIAGSMLGTKQTKEHIEKRLASKGNFNHSEKTKFLLSSVNLGKKLTDGTRNKMSEAKKGKQYRLGTKTSDETKAKLSIAGKGRKHTAEAKEKVAASKRGVPRTEEVKAKLRLAALEQWKIKKSKDNWIN